MVGPIFRQEASTTPAGTLVLLSLCSTTINVVFHPRSLLHDSKMVAAAPDIASVVQGGGKNRRREVVPESEKGKCFLRSTSRFLSMLCLPEVSRGHL